MRPITNYLQIVPGKLKDYKQLHRYHYIKSPVAFMRKVFVIRPRFCYKKNYPDIIGVIVYSPPIATLKPRNRVIDDPRIRTGTLSERHKFVTDNFTYISRIIVDPRFRRLSLARWLLEYSLPLQQYPFIETLTPIDFTNDLFKSFGFELHHNEAPGPFRTFANDLKQYGISGSLLTQPIEAQKRIDCLDPNNRKAFDHRLHRFLWTYRRHRHDKDPLDRITYALSKFPYPHAYLLKKTNFESA